MYLNATLKKHQVAVLSQFPVGKTSVPSRSKINRDSRLAKLADTRGEMKPSPKSLFFLSAALLQSGVATPRRSDTPN